MTVELSVASYSDPVNKDQFLIHIVSSFGDHLGWVHNRLADSPEVVHLSPVLQAGEVKEVCYSLAFEGLQTVSEEAVEVCRVLQW